MHTIPCAFVQVMLFAFKTDTLPVARDVCTQYRWLHHKGEWYGHLFVKFETLLFFNSTSASEAVYNNSLDWDSGVKRWSNSTALGLYLYCMLRYTSYRVM